MIQYGTAPEAHEIELTVFGPGLGEAIAAHLGEGTWLLVDSCKAEHGSGPATAEYLDALGVDAAQVRAVVATHWHDDHVCAISKLAQKYGTADFYMSGVLRESEAVTFLATYGSEAAFGQTGGTRELATILRSRKVKVVNSQTYLVDETINGRNVRVSAFSPLPEVHRKAAAHLGQYLVKQGQPINKAPPEPSPNAAAIVLHLDFGDDAVLLGADLEDNKNWGWTAMVGDPWIIRRSKASAYKVAHHGSRTSDCEHIWTTLLTSQPVACVTPFIWGRHRLPTDEDKARLRSRTTGTYISSDASSRPAIANDQLKRLNDICTEIRRVDTGFGAVRLRKKLGATVWSVDLFGAARKL